MGLLQVIFMFGEIDCREGLLLAVDKLKYPDLQAAMHVLADIYMQARQLLFCRTVAVPLPM